MKIKVKVEDLKTGFRSLATAFQSSTKSTSAILSSPDLSFVQMTAWPAQGADPGYVIVEGEVEGVFARYRYNAVVEEPGKIMVPMAYLYTISYPNAEVTLTVSGNNIQLNSGNMDMCLEGIINQSIAINTPAQVCEITHTLEANHFARASSLVGFYQMHQGNAAQKPMLRIEFETGCISSSANDSFSGAVANVIVPNLSGGLNFLMYSSFLDGMLGILGNTPINVGVSERAIRFTSTNFDCQFPRIQEDPAKPYQKVRNIRKFHDSLQAKPAMVDFDFNPQEALIAVNTVSSLQYATRNKVFPIVLEIQDNGIRVGTSASYGQAKNSFAATIRAGQGRTLSMHSAVLTNFLNLMVSSQDAVAQWIVPEGPQPNSLGKLVLFKNRLAQYCFPQVG